jgi:hypothetical protein
MGASGEQSIRSARLADDTLARPTSTQLTETPCSDRWAQPRDLQLLVLEAGRARREAGLAGGGHEHDRADPSQWSAVLLWLNEPPGVWVRDQLAAAAVCCCCRCHDDTTGIGGGACACGRMMAELLRSGAQAALLDELRGVYAQRCAALCAALREALPVREHNGQLTTTNLPSSQKATPLSPCCAGGL